jgi:flagellar FliJ protein
MAETAGTSEETWMIRGPTEMEGQVIDLKRRIPILKRLIADCDRLAADLEQEVRNEEHRVKIHDPTDLAYSTYAQAATNRRDNLRRSAEEFRAHLARAEKALLELGETPLGVRPD